MEERKNTDYQNFKASDFALDDTFIDWVKNPDSNYREFWEDWYDGNSNMQEEVDLAKTLVISLQFNQKVFSSNEIDLEWKQLQTSTVSQQKKYISWKQNSNFNNFLRIAAILVIAISFAFIFSKLNKILPELTQIDTVRKETLTGQKLSFFLPDGTHVKLNAESSIEYPEEFYDHIREVTIKGEAFFEVVKDKERPFKVKTGNVTTEVIGTSFNVNYYPESPLLQIALTEGKVMVTNSAKEKEAVTLEPGEMVTINKKNGELDLANFDEEEIIGWKEGILHFDKISFVEAISKMERWYGMKFSIDQKAKLDPNWRFHGKFKDRSLEYTLSVISYPDLFNYKIQKDTVFIY